MAEIELEYDCLIEILSRLPVKSLIRFTCVSKGWLSIIRSPEFVTKHYLESQKKPNQSVLSLLTPGCSISIFSSQNQNQNLTFETAFKFRPTVAYDPLCYQIYHRDIINYLSVVGPCNGLFLMSVGKGYPRQSAVLLLWNPATREICNLPLSPAGHCRTFGFGYDSDTHDYKVVDLYALINGVMDYSVVWLNSSATNFWRQLHGAYDRVELCPHWRLSNDSSSNGSMHSWILTNSSSNGRMHSWILTNFHPSVKESLLSFDMVDEVFVETPLPPDDESRCAGLMNHGSNQPCVYYFNQNNESLDIWILSGDYGSTGVWNKLLNINLPKFFGYMVLCNNEIVYSSPGGTITSFNSTTKQMKSLGIPAGEAPISYTESLVSIANSVRQPPSPPGIHLSSLQIDDNSNSNDVMETQQMLPQEDDDDSDDSSSSTDSAFFTPDITDFNDPGTVYIDYKADIEFFPLRLNEVERLSKLPYCLLELNRPMVSNPSTF